MVELVSAAAILAAAFYVGFKLDRLLKATEATGDRYFTMQEAYRKAERAYEGLAGKVDHMASHFSYPPVTDPVPLPSIDDETAAEPRRKRGKRGR